jgi:hypothetical protein
MRTFWIINSPWKVFSVETEPWRKKNWYFQLTFFGGKKISQIFFFASTVKSFWSLNLALNETNPHPSRALLKTFSLRYFLSVEGYDLLHVPEKSKCAGKYYFRVIPQELLAHTFKGQFYYCTSKCSELMCIGREQWR